MTSKADRNGGQEPTGPITKGDRSAISRAVAKAIAYHDCGKPEKAALWAAELGVMPRLRLSRF
jgi:hypothetical protein